MFNCLLIWSFSRALFLRVSIILWKLFYSNDPLWNLKNKVTPGRILCLSVVQKFLEFSYDDPFLLVSVNHVHTSVFCACSWRVCVCVHAHFIFSFVSPIAYSTVDIYVLNATVRRIWISVNCRGLFCLLEQKKSKMRSFYKNVQWWHFRPSAIKDWRQPSCHIFFFLFLLLNECCGVASS